MVHSFFCACSTIAATTLGCWWPMLVLTICDEVQQPCTFAVPDVGALGLGDGHRLEGGRADHEWNTCLRSEFVGAAARFELGIRDGSGRIVDGGHER